LVYNLTISDFLGSSDGILDWEKVKNDKKQKVSVIERVFRIWVMIFDL
jgi:hypothetical protein